MKPRRIAIAYNIRSAHNVGSLFRTADAAGVDTLYLCGITPAPIDRFGRDQKDIAKTALGAEKYIAWEKIGASPTSAATLALIKKLRKENFFIVAIEQSQKSIPYTRVRAAARNAQKKDIALIVGDEVRGLPRSILNAADCIAEIPMRGKKESLNVAVAFGIAVFALWENQQQTRANVRSIINDQTSAPARRQSVVKKTNNGRETTPMTQYGEVWRGVP